MAEFDSVIPAGGSGKLTAKVKTSTTQYGAISKTVSVTTDAVGAERMSLNIRFTAIASVEVLPRAQVHLSGTEGEAVTRQLLVRRRDGKPLEITEIRNQDQRISITTETLDKATVVGKLSGQKGDVVMTVATPPDLEAVGVNGRFRFGTNHPDAKTVTVNYAIRLRPLIEPRPTQVRLILQEGNEPARTGMLRVHHNKNEKFTLTGVSPSNPDLFTAQLIDGDAEQPVHTVAVMLAEDLQAGDLATRAMEKLVVITDDPANPEVEITVLIEPRSLRRPGQPRALE